MERSTQLDKVLLPLVSSLPVLGPPTSTSASSQLPPSATTSSSAPTDVPADAGEGGVSHLLGDMEVESFPVSLSHSLIGSAGRSLTGLFTHAPCSRPCSLLERTIALYPCSPSWSVPYSLQFAVSLLLSSLLHLFVLTYCSFLLLLLSSRLPFLFLVALCFSVSVSAHIPLSAFSLNANSVCDVMKCDSILTAISSLHPHMWVLSETKSFHTVAHCIHTPKHNLWEMPGVPTALQHVAKWGVIVSVRRSVPVQCVPTSNALDGRVIALDLLLPTDAGSTVPLRLITVYAPWDPGIVGPHPRSVLFCTWAMVRHWQL